MSLYDHSPKPQDSFLTRRQMLQRCGMGMGALALGNLLGGAAFGSTDSGGGAINPLAVKNPHFPGKAKRVIHLFMNGGPSQVDTFDPKPMLEKYAGKNLPTPNLKTERRTGAPVRALSTKRGDRPRIRCRRRRVRPVGRARDLR